MPKKVDLPEHICLDETNKDLNSIKTQQSIFIEKIFCSNKQSGILLTNGQFWACGNCQDAGKDQIKSSNSHQTTSPEEESKR